MESYTPDVMHVFFNKYLCLGDKELIQLKDSRQSKLLARKLSKLDPEKVKENIERVIFSTVVNELHDIIIKNMEKVSIAMRPFGFVVMAGGSVVNYHLPPEHRVVSRDMDYKFVPIMKGITHKNPKYFGYLQYAKIYMWNMLGKLAKSFSISAKIRQRLSGIQNSWLGKTIGLRFRNPTFRARYTLIPKSKQGGLNVREGNVLIDVEVMSVDVYGITWKLPGRSSNRFKIGGLIDVAYMRQGEMGAHVLKGMRQGIEYQNIDTGKMVWAKNVFFPGKKFIIEDIHMLKSLQLRPKKIAIDRMRMELIAKHAFNVSRVSKYGNSSLVNKAVKVTSQSAAKFRVPAMSMKLIKFIENINVYKFAKYVTRLPPKQVIKYTLPLKTRMGIPMNKLINVQKSSGYMFNSNTKKWVKVNNSDYIRNMAKYRIQGGVKIPLLFEPKLYGYKPDRDAWIPNNIIKSAAHIPMVGHKDLSIK